jgi:AcrR family transcriptional regulator
MSIKSDRRREEVLVCFERLVAKYGVDKTTMRDVAREMGLSVGTLYNEFKDKEELVTTLMNKEIDSFLVRLVEKEKKAGSIEEKLYVLTVIRTNMLNEALKNNEHLFDYITREPKPLKYIGKVFGGKRIAIDSAILKRIVSILLTAKREHVINIDNPSETARIFLDAFVEYTAPADMCGLSSQERVHYAEVMYKHLIFSLIRKETNG